MGSKITSFRVNLRATPKFHDWVDAPVVVDLNLGDLAQAAGLPRDSIDKGSIRVRDADSKEVPFRIDSSLRANLRIRESGIDSPERCEVSWVKEYGDHRDYVISFNVRGKVPSEPPVEIPLIGCGDSLTVGYRGTAGRFMAPGFNEHD